MKIERILQTEKYKKKNSPMQINNYLIFYQKIK